MRLRQARSRVTALSLKHALHSQLFIVHWTCIFTLSVDPARTSARMLSSSFPCRARSTGRPSTYFADGGRRSYDGAPRRGGTRRVGAVSDAAMVVARGIGAACSFAERCRGAIARAFRDVGRGRHCHNCVRKYSWSARMEHCVRRGVLTVDRSAPRRAASSLCACTNFAVFHRLPITFQGKSEERASINASGPCSTPQGSEDAAGGSGAVVGVVAAEAVA